MLMLLLSVLLDTGCLDQQRGLARQIESGVECSLLATVLYNVNKVTESLTERFSGKLFFQTSMSVRSQVITVTRTQNVPTSMAAIRVHVNGVILAMALHVMP